MRLLIALSLMVSHANAVYSAPQPNDACAYFAKLVTLEIDASNREQFDRGGNPQFALKSRELDRYAVYFSQELIGVHGFINRDGKMLETGSHAYQLACRVDEVDRRVLEIHVRNGSSVGKEIEIDGTKATPIGVIEKTYDIGDRSDKGKY